ncbi:hypothetical protein [Nocardia sp. NPDC127526]|uniref:hypothetical protein n=1 Tax=Nocardia sp. NPDC127526 TaxID=3345393 RepID=UPI00363C951D
MSLKCDKCDGEAEQLVKTVGEDPDVTQALCGYHMARFAIDYLAWGQYDEAEKEIREVEPSTRTAPLLNATEKLVWAAWKELPDDDPSPVKRIAKQLGMATGDVAFIVYPVEEFGRWSDDQEPDL